MKLFVSYSHDDLLLVRPFMVELRRQLKACTQMSCEVWQDTQILCGTGWDQSIKEALKSADLGLLLVSPAFRCSRYIKDVEMPHLLAKGCVAVGLGKLCFTTQLDPALAAMQIHRHSAPRAGELFYSECATRQQREAFVHGLYLQILARVQALATP